MTLGGWLIMIASVGGVTVLFIWCIFRVLMTPGASNRVHAPTDIDTHQTP
jgi:hypothetical protein